MKKLILIGVCIVCLCGCGNSGNDSIYQEKDGMVSYNTPKQVDDLFEKMYTLPYDKQNIEKQVKPYFTKECFEKLVKEERFTALNKAANEKQVKVKMIKNTIGIDKKDKEVYMISYELTLLVDNEKDITNGIIIFDDDIDLITSWDIYTEPLFYNPNRDILTVL